MNDLKFACRQLLKNSGFTAVAVLTLALGIGANVAVYSMVNAILLRPFPATDPGRLVSISMYDQKYGATERGSMSLPDLFEFQARAESCQSLFGMYSDGFVLGGDEGAERIQGSVVSPSFLDVLGVRPALGRGFVAQEGDFGGGAVMLISHALWRRRFNAQTNLESIQARVNGSNAQVIGVMPPGFRFPIETDLWMPLRRNPEASRGNRYLRVIGKLKQGVSLEQADSEAHALAEGIAGRYPETNKDLTASAYELRTLLIPGPIRLLLWLLLGAVGCVLLITCANVAGLILVRGWTRRKELAIRASLGASRSRVFGLLIQESLVLAALGGMAGLALSRLGLDAIIALIPEQIPYWIHFSMDWRVMAFTVGASVVAGLGAGLVPAWQTVRTDPASVLKESSATTTGSRPQHRIRQILVVGEMAVSLALLIGAGLMIRTFLATQNAALGFETEKRLVFQMVLPPAQYPSQADKTRLAEQVMERLTARPEFEAAGALHPSLPLADFTSSSMYVAVGQPDEAAQNAGNINVVGDALQTLGVRLIQGRFFEPLELASGRPVCLINQTMASRFFPNEEALGRRIRFRGNLEDPGMEIVGVLDDVRRNSIHEKPENQVFRPFAQISWGGTFSVVARTKTDPRALTGAVRDEVHAVAPEVAIHDIQSLDDFVARNESYWISRMNGWLFSALGVAALVITLTGLYGVIAFSVGQRTKEFGLRLALGATRSDLVRLVIGLGARLAVLGLGMGLVLALGLTRLMSGLLFGVTPAEPFTYMVVLGVTAAAVFAASWVPARRAAKADPMEALRNE